MKTENESNIKSQIERGKRMNLFYIRYFVELAKEQQYTKAAKNLNITQPSLSHAIHQLEEDLGYYYLKRQDVTLYLRGMEKNFWSMRRIRSGRSIRAFV